MMMDPPIKLFGKTIAFTTSASSQDDALDGAGTTSTGGWGEFSSSPQEGQESGGESGAKSEVTLSEGPASCFPELSSSGSNGADEEKNSSPRGVHGLLISSSEASRGRVTEESEDVEDLASGHGEGTTSQEVSGDDTPGKGQKVLRRPDKAVACPRCHSLETKFCYYNNYNVKQPRHFCKHCQRYWTAGGTLRNVPVGAGRRKNKHGSLISPRQNAEMGLVRGDEPDVATPLLVGKGVTLPVPVPVPVVQTVLGGTIPGSNKPVIRMPVAGGPSDGGGQLPYATVRVPSLEGTYILTSSDGVKPIDAAAHGGNLPRVSAPGFDDATTGGSDVVDGSRSWQSKEESFRSPFQGSRGSSSVHEVKGEVGTPPEHHRDTDASVPWKNAAAGVRTSSAPAAPFGFLNGGWPYGYNVGWSGGAAAFCAGGVPNAANGLPPPTAGVAAWGGAAAGNMWTGIPWPIPDLAWSPAGWGAPWSLGNWAIGAAAAGAAVAMSPAISAGGPGGLHAPMPCPTGAGSPSLGKHSLSYEGGGPVEGAVWAPKSLRMADPEEALRSSVWRILGVGARPDMATASTFKAFQPKGESKKVADDEQHAVQAALHANPAAMSRPVYFHESN